MKLQDRAKIFFAGLFFKGLEYQRKLRNDMNPTNTAAAGKIYEFSVKTIDGKDKKLADYKGHPLLIVNVASKCGFTPQYETLEALHKKYEGRGLRVLGFPANEFGAQEPGSDAQIKEFCTLSYGVSFDMFSKIVVKGAGIHPLYKFLTTESGFPGDITWNFSKFLVGKDGAIVARFGPDADPMGSAIVPKVESVL